MRIRRLRRKVLAKSQRPSLEAAADSIELPFAVVAVELTATTAVSTEERSPRQDHNESVQYWRSHQQCGYKRADLTEILLAGLSLIDSNGEADLINTCGNSSEVDLDLLIVTIAFAGQVIAHVLDAARLCLRFP